MPVPFRLSLCSCLLVSSLSAAAQVRPQTPQPPFPYRVEEVVFSAQPGIDLAATLTLPEGEGPFPAAVLISGSGKQTRNGDILGHQTYWVLADYLTRQGIAVLRYDERGVGQSTGQFESATSADLGGDVLAALQFLERQPGIDPNRTGLIGHSEGGFIAPMIAAQNRKTVDFCVLLAGPGVPADQVLLRQMERIMTLSGQDSSMIVFYQELMQGAYQVMKKARSPEEAKGPLYEWYIAKWKTDYPGKGPNPADRSDFADQEIKTLLSPWFFFFIQQDPTPWLKKTRCPVLALNGSLDCQVVAAQNLPAIGRLLRHPDSKTIELPGLNHLFQNAPTGNPLEYGLLDETFDPATLGIISDWILGI